MEEATITIDTKSIVYDKKARTFSFVRKFGDKEAKINNMTRVGMHYLLAALGLLDQWKNLPCPCADEKQDHGNKIHTQEFDTAMTEECAKEKKEEQSDEERLAELHSMCTFNHDVECCTKRGCDADSVLEL